MAEQPVVSSDSSTEQPAQAGRRTGSFMQVADGTRIHYETHGPESSPRKLMLIMGFLTDGAAWVLQTEHFAKLGYHCVSYDNRGVAQSSTPGYTQLRSYSTRSMAADALSLATHLEWDQFHVVGVSMGGMIALELALAAPLRVRSLTLAVTHAGGLGSLAPLQGMKQMIVSMFTRSDEARLAAIMSMLYSKETLADEELSAKLRGHHIDRMKTRIAPKFAALLGHTYAVYTHYVPYSSLLRIRYSHFPIQVIVGAEDKLVQKGNSLMLSRVLGAKLIEVPRSAHGLFAEHPDLLNDTLHQFVEGAEQAKAQGDKSHTRSSSPEDADAEDEAEDAAAQLLNEDSSDASPYSLEEQALKLACSHSAHCALHNVAGFITGFAAAFAFRYVFFSQIASASSPADSRSMQAVRFGLLVGAIRCAWRAARCIIHTNRARRFVSQHKLIAAPHTPSTSEAPLLRKGIPRNTGIADFPWHSIATLGACAALLWQQKLLAGVFSG